MPWSLQTVGSTIFYIPGGSNLPLAGAGTIGTNNNGTIIMVGRGTNSIAAYNIGTNTWSIPSTLFSTTGRSVAVGAQKYVAVGEGTNTFAITNNGTTWGTIASPPFSTAGYDIVYADSTWVAVGTGTNSVAYYNGTSWVSVSNGITSGYGLFYDATVPRIWATGSGSNTIAYASAANSTWTGVAIPNMTRVNAVGSGSSSSLWVAIGNNILATSTNGQSWTSQTVTNFSTAGGFGSVYYANSMWMVIAGNGTSTTSNRIFTSSNATSWTASINNRGGAFGQGIGYGPGTYANVNTNIWVTGGGQGLSNTISTVQLSNDDGTNWYPVNSVGAAPINNRGLCVAFGKDGNGGNLWLVGGYAVNPLGYKDRISEVGINITASSLTTVTGIATVFTVVNIAPSINGIAWGQHSSGSNLWVAVGNQGATGGGGNTIAYSRDGLANWVGLGASVFTGYGWGVAFGKDENNVNLWVAVGQGGNTIAYSYDGSANWVGAGTSVFSTRGFAVAYSGGTWVAAGSGGNSLAYSTNGRSWTGITTNNPIGTAGSGLGVYGTTTQLYVAGGIGTNNLQTSSNGTSWTSVTSPFSVAVNDVKNNGTTWVAVGEGGNTIATSSNGSSWTGQGTTTFSLRGNKVRWNSTQNKWYAVGEGGNTLVASTDGTGTIWTSINTTGYVDISGLGLAFN